MPRVINHFPAGGAQTRPDGAICKDRGGRQQISVWPSHRWRLGSFSHSQTRRVVLNRSNVLKTSSCARASGGFEERRVNSASIAGMDSGARAARDSSPSFQRNHGRAPSTSTRRTAAAARSCGSATAEAIRASLATSSGSRSVRSGRSAAQFCRSTPISASKADTARRRHRLEGISSSALGSGVTAEISNALRLLAPNRRSPSSAAILHISSSSARSKQGIASARSNSAKVSMTPGRFRLLQNSRRNSNVSSSRQAPRRRPAVFLTASSANCSWASTIRLGAHRNSMSTSRAPNKANASTAHILGWGTLVMRPHNKNSRKRGTALLPQATNSSIADWPSTRDSRHFTSRRTPGSPVATSLSVYFWPVGFIRPRLRLDRHGELFRN